MKKQTIAIIEGGFSKEREISLLSAASVFHSIDPEKYTPIRVKIDHQGWFAFDQKKWREINKHDFTFKRSEKKIHFDFALIVIHGPPGEDGRLQAYFDLLKIPYSTSDHRASSLTFNKFYCNQFLRSNGIPIAKSFLINKDEKHHLSQIVNEINLPCFVKPAESGSSIGVTKVKQFKELNPSIEYAFNHHNQVLIEAFLPGREISCGIYKLNEELHVLPITEIISENAFFDFNAKYNGKAEEITPANVSEESENDIIEMTKRIYLLLNLKGICRIDYILTDSGLYFLEVNTVPGFTHESIIPNMLAAAETSLQNYFQELLEYQFK